MSVDTGVKLNLANWLHLPPSLASSLYRVDFSGDSIVALYFSQNSGLSVKKVGSGWLVSRDGWQQMNFPDLEKALKYAGSL